MIFLKNYTSDVPVSQTLYRIEQVLVRCGVSGFMKMYGNSGEVTAVLFQVKIKDGDREAVQTIRLPADKERAWQALWLDYADGEKLSADGMKLQWCTRKKKVKLDFKEQAERTAWKLVQDWIEVQMSLVQMKQADMMQVFLPYAWDGERTFYDRVREAHYAGLLPESTEREP